MKGPDTASQAPRHEPTLLKAAIWSLAWLAAAALVGVIIWVARGSADAGSYAGAYLIERALSLDNVVVFLMLFVAFAVSGPERARLLWWGIAAAIVMRAVAILGGVALVDRFEPLLYLLGVLLLVLAWRMLKGGTHEVDPERSLAVRAVRRVVPVATDAPRGAFMLRRAGRLHATPLLLCLAAIVLADLAFALDSVPAAHGRDPRPAADLAGERDGAARPAPAVRARGRPPGPPALPRGDLAALLALVAVKLLTEDLIHIGPAVSVAAVVAVLLVGIAASLAAERQGPPLGSRIRAFVDELEDRRARHRERSRLLRAGYGALAVGVLCAGLAMLVLPGPRHAADSSGRGHAGARVRMGRARCRPHGAPWRGRGGQGPLGARAAAGRGPRRARGRRGHGAARGGGDAGGWVMSPYRLLMVDDHAAVRGGLGALLAGEPDLEPVGSAAGAREALELARRLHPHVAIVDFQLGDRDGLTLCRQLKQLVSPTRVLLYSAYADGPLALAAVIAGADGVVHKAALAEHLCEAIRVVAAGGSAVPAISPASHAMVAECLEPEDLPILAMLVAGTDPAEIADVLGVPPDWLDARRWAMVERLRRVSGRREAATTARGGLPA